LKAEAALFNQAAAAMARGDALAALDVLARHRERFPNGQYAKQREAMLAQLCALRAMSKAPACTRRGVKP